MPAAPNKVVSQPPPHLPYLDGLRGFAALYVVVSHVYFEIGPSGDGAGLPRALAVLSHFLTFGHLAVAVFIVLSGYCLMLPLACSSEGVLRGRFGGYLFRRARRILPPYYTALALFLLLIGVVPALRTPCAAEAGCRWGVALPVFTPSIVLSHLLLVHNFSNEWIVKIDPPMWSIATEWQIYFFFPLLLLPIWQRFGVVVAVAAACIVAQLPRLLLPPAQNLESACPQYLALFAFGMAGAAWGFRSPLSPLQSRRAGLATLLFFGTALVALLAAGTETWLKYVVLGDYLTGAATAGLLVYATATHQEETAHLPTVVRLLTSRFAVFLGRFSYSIYLIHFPILSLCHAALRPFFGNSGRDLVWKFALLLLVAAPISLLVSYGFYWLVERHFVGSPRRRTIPEIALLSETKTA